MIPDLFVFYRLIRVRRQIWLWLLFYIYGADTVAVGLFTLSYVLAAEPLL